MAYKDAPKTTEHKFSEEVFLAIAVYDEPQNERVVVYEFSNGRKFEEQANKTGG